ncbi:Small nuclear RNA activating complex protein [Actinidia chinensis var. chinensis]|uniref:Small nuclear RNA activating complex protein n=1 Tax=Actinidia chinensis var. chinensis TaxID=1590841 RepID=A0A2R6QRY5_ACTCC|nr:Small nuclear RNA activating complex protein [Actinidia chinensis var. chinensis]
MDLKPFKLDIDELINEFAENKLTTLGDMKRVWLSRKFSFIFEASPTTNLAFFMQSLYAHSIGHMVSPASLSHRLGGLYCLYCLYEVQPFKPPFKIYLSLGELKRLRHLLVDAKEKSIKVVSVLVNKMLEKNVFLFGFVDINDSSVTERVNELTHVQNNCVQVAYKRLFSNTRIEKYIHMDLGTELEVGALKKMSKDYATAKELAIGGASELVNVENIKHIAESKRLIGEVVEKTAQDWKVQKDLFFQQTGLDQQAGVGSQLTQGNEIIKHQKVEEDDRNFEQRDDNETVEQLEDDENFGEELEKQMLSYEEV